MYKTLLVLTLLFITACSDPDSNSVDLDSGEGSITIGDMYFGAEATLENRMLGDDEYEQITLAVSDTFFVQILNQDFQKGVFNWSGEGMSSGGNMIFMTHFERGAGFGPRSGFLIISSITDKSISGLFMLEMHNFASCCYNCPEDRVSIEGEFNATWE